MIIDHKVPVTYIPHWLSQDDADHYFDCTRLLPWQQDKIMLYGKRYPIPRQQAWLSKDSLPYQYSGITLTSAGWPLWVDNLCHRVSQQAEVDFNSVLANLYRHGGDKMGWHSDDEASMGPVVAIASFGACRYLGVRAKGDTQMTAKYSLAHGSLLIMHGGMQAVWQHALLAQSRRRVNSARVSLTFRLCHRP